MKYQFCTRLKEAIKKSGLMQMDVVDEYNAYCKKNGINSSLSRPLLSMYVHGKAEPSSTRLAVLAVVLNVSEAWLLGYDIPEGSPSLERIEILVEFEELTDVNKARLMAYLKALKDSQEDQT